MEGFISRFTFHVSRFTFHASRIALAIGVFLHLLTASTDAAFLDKAGVRPLGMGGAFVARADDSSAGLWNPAGLAQLKQSEFVATYSALYTGLGEDNLGRTYLGYTLPVHRLGTLGLNVVRLQGPLYSENTLLLSYSHHLRSLYVGGTVKGLFANFGENEYTRDDPLFKKYGRLTKDVSFDLGLLLKVSEFFAVGVAAQNLNQPNLALEDSAESLLPRELKAGFSLKFGRVRPSLDLTWRDTTIRDKQDFNVHLGLETWLTRDIGLRTGVNFDELAAGASYRFYGSGGEFQLDYAFNYPTPFDIANRGQESLSGTSGTHQFALSVRFSDFLQLMGSQKPPQESAKVPQPETGRAITSQETEELKSAIAAYLLVLQHDEANLDAHFFIAQNYAKLEQYDKAIPHLKRAVELAPDNPRYRYTLGLLYEQYGDVTKSKSWYNKAIIELEKTRMLNADYENVSAKIEAISKKGR